MTRPGPARGPEPADRSDTARRSDPTARPHRPGSRLLEWVEACVAGRVWWYRAPLLVLLAWIFRGYLADPTGGSIFSGINLGFHEMGHAAFSWSGSRILTVAGGTIFEVGVPLGAAAYLALRQRDPFGAAVCLFWCGTALVGAGVYAADARAQVLPLVSPFGPVDVDSHDWTVMLMKYGRLTHDQEIGAALRHAGVMAMAVGLLLGAGVLRVMARTTGSARRPL